MTQEEKRQEALENVKCALILIERAQHDLSSAAQLLCPVRGIQEEWRECGEAYDKVRELWRSVDISKRQVTELDKH